METVQLRVDVPAELRRSLKFRALEEGKTLRALVVEILSAGMKPAEPK